MSGFVDFWIGFFAAIGFVASVSFLIGFCRAGLRDLRAYLAGDNS